MLEVYWITSKNIIFQKKFKGVLLVNLCGFGTTQRDGEGLRVMQECEENLIDA